MLADAKNWEQYGDLTPDEASQLAFDTINNERVNCMIVGTVIAWAGDTIPDALLLADGSIVNKDDYPLLWDVWPNAYKTPTTLTLLDMRDKFIVGVGTHVDREAGGAADVTLDIDTMPAHTHSIGDAYGPSVLPGYVGDIPGFVPAPTAVATTSTGGGLAHNNMPPYLALRWCVVAK